MARQRTLKPEYFRDRLMGRLGPVIGTVYKALWCWADDGGVARCDPQVLKAECFLWWPDITTGVITDSLVSLQGATRVRIYAVGDELYAELPTLGTHSPVNHPSKFRYPRGGQDVTDLRAWLSGQYRVAIREPSRESLEVAGTVDLRKPSSPVVPSPVPVAASSKAATGASSDSDADAPRAPAVEEPDAAVHTTSKLLDAMAPELARQGIPAARRHLAAQLPAAFGTPGPNMGQETP
jgi:hypothetical protein